MPTAVMAPRALPILLVIAGIAGVVGVWRDRAKLFRVCSEPITICLGVMTLLILLSSLWSVSPSLTLSKSFSTIGIFGSVVLCIAALFVAPSNVIEKLITPLLWGAVCGLGLLGFEVITDAALTRWLRQDDLLSLPSLNEPIDQLLPLNRSMAAVAIIAWPTLIGVWSRKPQWAIALALVIVLLLSEGDSFAPVAAFTFGMIAALCVWRLPIGMYRVIGAILAIAVMASPLSIRVLPDPETATETYTFLPSSTVHRLWIWNTTVDYIEQKPVLGWGFATSRTFSSPEESSSTVLMRMPSGHLYHGTSEPIPLHPHNVMLQWWLELGVLGALIGGMIIGLLVAGFVRLSKAFAALAFGVTVTSLFMMAISFGAWQSWWLSTLAIGGLLTWAVLRCVSNGEPKQR